MAKKDDGLTPLQARFVEEYLIDLKAGPAYKRAGFKVTSAGSAEVGGCRMLRNVNVIAAINRDIINRSKRTAITQDNILKDLNEIKERCMQRAPVMEYDPELKMMVQAKDENGKNIWQFDANPAIRSLELLGKHLKMWIDKTELTGKDDSQIIINILLQKPNQ
jgi:phage terminase small subunit